MCFPKPPKAPEFKPPEPPPPPPPAPEEGPDAPVTGQERIKRRRPQSGGRRNSLVVPLNVPGAASGLTIPSE